MHQTRRRRSLMIYLSTLRERIFKRLFSLSFRRKPKFLIVISVQWWKLSRRLTFCKINFAKSLKIMEWLSRWHLIEEMKVMLWYHRCTKFTQALRLILKDKDRYNQTRLILTWYQIKLQKKIVILSWVNSNKN